jgi:hypothetical protein
MARSWTISSPGSMCPDGAPESPGASFARATGDSFLATVMYVLSLAVLLGVAEALAPKR